MAGGISIPHTCKLGFSEIFPPQSLLQSNLQILNSFNVKSSIFLWFFPEGKPGPIVNYRRSGHGLGLWLSHTRVLEGRVYSRRNYYKRKLYFTHFVPGRWYYVGLMYDNTHGYALLWVNGRVVRWFSLYIKHQTTCNFLISLSQLTSNVILSFPTFSYLMNKDYTKSPTKPLASNS